MTPSADLCATGAAHDSTERTLIARLTGFLLLYKLAFFALIWSMAYLWPTLYRLDGFELHSRGSATSRAVALPVSGMWRYFETWDAHHYLHLARFGYGDQPMSLAFYPLWPFLIRLTAPLFGGNFTLTALVLSNAFSVAALVLLHRLVARRFNEKTAHRTLVLIIAFPGALFLCLPYTESLFLFCCVALFWLIENARVGALRTNSASPPDWPLVVGVAACAVAAASARPPGLFLIIPLALFAWMQRDHPVWRVVALAPIIGFLSYFATIYLATGDVTAGIQAQKLFSSQASIGKLLDVPGFVHRFFDAGPGRGGSGYVHDRVWFILFCSTLWPLWKLDRLWFSFAIMMGLVTAFGVSMMSFMRYFSIIFPCFIVMAKWFEASRARYAFLTSITILFFLQIYFLLLHINYGWAS